MPFKPPSTPSLPLLLRLSFPPKSSQTPRHNSTLATLTAEMTARRPPHISDILTPQPSHLLSLSLLDFLPAAALPAALSDPPTLPSVSAALPMPQAHHLVYFPPQIRDADLLPDGTDPLQSPGEPFVRRMWAGGKVAWNKDASKELKLDGSRAVCIEGVRDVSFKGTAAEKNEKVFVGIERRMGRVSEGESAESVRARLWPDGVGDAEVGECAVVERRNLVFMRERAPSEVAAAANAKARVVKPPNPATFSHALTPPATLLFRYSALTFNAHSIHLDTAFCRAIEGHRNLLVHGPLSFTLMVSLLTAQLKATAEKRGGEELMIEELEYRNLAPLYAEEELKVCGREKEGKGGEEYEVWIETPEGGYAVRGSAKVGRR